jgi:hypothetical protein
MSMTTQVAAARIQREMQALETALLSAQAAAAQLKATCATARVNQAAPLMLGYEPLRRLTQLEEGLLKLGGETARVHAGLLDVGREVMMPDEECPDVLTPIGLSAAA